MVCGVNFVDQTEEQEELSNTYIFFLYAPIMFVMFYLANRICFGPFLLKNAERSLRYHVKRELPKHKNCERTNGVITHYVLKF